MSDDTSSPTGAGMSPERLRHFASSLRDLDRGKDVDETLQLMVDLAVDTVDSVQVAGVMLNQSGRISTPVASDELAAELDRIQRVTEDGPCVMALREQEVVVSQDLEHEERWPVFTSRAIDRGIRSVAAYRLFRDDSDGQDLHAALNMFGTGRGFDGLDLDLGEVIAAYCSVVLAGVFAEQGTEVALLSREVIGEAKGILMVRHALTPDEAHAMLRRAAADHDIQIHVLATQVVAGTTTLR